MVTEIPNGGQINTFQLNTINGLPIQSQWLRPKKWNNPAFDAIYINKKVTKAYFIQVTIAEYHSVDLAHVKRAFKALKGRFPTLKTEEFVFVIPQNRKNDFKGLGVNQREIRTLVMSDDISGYF